MSKEEQLEFEKDIENKIREIDNTMALEGMPLSKDFKEALKNCFYGTTSMEKERQKILDRYKRIYGW